MGRFDYHYDQLHNDESAKLFTYLLIVFNMVYAVLGALMLTAGFYICLDEEFRTYVHNLGMNKYMVGVYILMIAGAMVLVEAFFGICGAYLKQSKLLNIFFATTLVSFILEIIGSSYLLANGVSGSKLDAWLSDKFYSLIAAYTFDLPSRRSMNIVQTYIGCCGASGISDYVDWNIPIPSSCFDPIIGNAWYRDGYGYVGCVYGLSKYVERGTGWIVGLALFLALFQIVGMVSARCLVDIKRNFRFKSLGDLRKN